MRLVGFSTGALAFADFRRGLQMLRETGAKAVELSALRAAELDPLMESLDDLDLTSFRSSRSTHHRTWMPSTSGTRWKSCRQLPSVAGQSWFIPTPFTTMPYGVVRQAVCIENMDKRKPIARTRDELCVWFDPAARGIPLPGSRARPTDRSHYDRGLPDSARLRESRGRGAPERGQRREQARTHFLRATLAYQQVASMIPVTIPVILESIVSAEFIDDEIEAAHEALAIGGPRPRVRKRRSSATPKPLRV